MAIRHLVGLDIGTAYVKALQLSERGGNYAVTGFGIAEIQPPKSPAEALQEALETGGFRTRRVVASVSGRSVYVRYVTMPRMGDTELLDAARYEIGKYIPVETAEVVFDAQKLGEIDPGGGREPEMRVLLAAAHRTFVDDRVAAIEDAGLQPVILDVDAFALGNAYELAGRINPDSVSPGRLIALADIGASKTSVHIMDDSGPFFTREIYKGGDDFTKAISARTGLGAGDAEALKRDVSGSAGPEAIVVLDAEDAKKFAPEPEPEEPMPIVVVDSAESARLRDDAGDAPRMVESIAHVIDDLCHDIQISIDYFENQHDRKVHEVLLTGGGASVAGLVDALEQLVQRPVRVWDPLNHIPLELSEGSLTRLRDCAPQTAIALGLASRLWAD